MVHLRHLFGGLKKFSDLKNCFIQEIWDAFMPIYYLKLGCMCETKPVIVLRAYISSSTERKAIADWLLECTVQKNFSSSIRYNIVFISLNPSFLA